MKHTLTRLLAAAAFTLIAVAACAQTADQTYGFAEQLFRDGDDAFALLEFKRFAYLHEADARAPTALLNVAVITLGYLEDVNGARALLARVATDYADTEFAGRARELNQFIEANSDFGGKPLIAFFRGQLAAKRDDHMAAARAYANLAGEWPKSTLGDDAFLALARLQHENLGKPAEAARTLTVLLTRYPNSPLAAEARLQRALALEKAKGPADAETLAAFAEVEKHHPGTPQAQQASERLAQIGKQADTFERRYDKALVQQYKLVKAGYDDKKRFVHTIEVPTAATPQQVSATLEDALLAAIGKRPAENDPVKVEAYFNYPLTEAGRAYWTRGTDPTYTLEERGTKDVLKDTLFDILRKR